MVSQLKDKAKRQKPDQGVLVKKKNQDFIYYLAVDATSNNNIPPPHNYNKNNNAREDIHADSDKGERELSEEEEEVK